MGRTLNFQITNSAEISDKEKDEIYRISLQYNADKYEKAWTCESFMLDPYGFHPNWAKVRGTGGWQPIEERYAELEMMGLSRRKIIEKMVEEGLVLYRKDTIFNGKIAGFCKVGGNEYNALLVYQALLQISRKTKAEISFQDEGEFLYADVVIKDGLVKIDVDKVKKAWDYWEKNGLLEEEGGYVTLKMKKQRQENLLEKYPTWTEPQNLCRTVQAEDFEAHPEYSAAQLMAGFHGEYFGLTDKDAEKESYKICGLIKGMAEKSGLTMDVAPKLPGMSKQRNNYTVDHP